MAKSKVSYWLFKEEPSHYSFDDLEREGSTVWDGVKNNLALKNLRQVKQGDRAFFYHTGKEKAVVGEMKVISNPLPVEGEDKLVTVEVESVRRLTPVTLARIKEVEELQDWELIRLSRLSIVPVSAEQWKLVLNLSRKSASSE